MSRKDPSHASRRGSVRINFPEVTGVVRGDGVITLGELRQLVDAADDAGLPDDLVVRAQPRPFTLDMSTQGPLAVRITFDRKPLDE